MSYLLVVREGLEVDADRFWPKVEVGQPDKCWEWKGCRSRGGYGRFRFRGRTDQASRAAYVLFVGEIGEGLDVCHLCDNPPCVNPRHLIAATAAINMFHASERGRLVRASAGNLSKLSPRDVAAIRQRYVDFRRALADEYGISVEHAERLLAGRFWEEVDVAA